MLRDSASNSVVLRAFVAILENFGRAKMVLGAVHRGSAVVGALSILLESPVRDFRIFAVSNKTV